MALPQSPGSEVALGPKGFGGRCDHNTVASFDWLDAAPQRTSKVTGPWELQPAADMRDMQRKAKRWRSGDYSLAPR